MKTPRSLHFLRHAGRAALGLSVCLVVACSAEPEKPQDRVSITSLPCAIDAECAELGFVCDDGRRTCVCTSDSMCEDKEGTPYCNAFTGHCVAEIAGCKTDSECSANEFCDGALRICREKKPYCGSCTQDAECGGPNDYCVKHPDFPGSASYCATACTAEGACPTGQACRDTEKGKQCVPENVRCQSGQSVECTPDSKQRCRENADCSGGQVCDDATSLCRAASSGCRASQSCDPISRKCVTSCEFNADCQERYGPNYVCEEQTCVPMESCLRDEDCGDDSFCFKMPGSSAETVGACQASCRSHDDCYLQQVCSDGPRRKCVSGCTSNADCPLNAICSNGSCEFKDSAGNRRCQLTEVCDFKEVCENNSCRLDPKHCGAGTSTCPQGGKLSAIFFSPGCVGGTAVACPAGSHQGVVNQGGGNANLCKIERCLYSCADHSDCPNGFYCDQWLGSICQPNENNAAQCY